MYTGHLRRYGFVYKHLISGTVGRERSIKKKRDVDGFGKANIRKLLYRKYA
jgi:5,10-methylene-tetrahydrofolate dehydrogenase/methenyl tetrahydrofolate cyclohydrolase